MLIRGEEGHLKGFEVQSYVLHHISAISHVAQEFQTALRCCNLVDFEGPYQAMIPSNQSSGRKAPEWSQVLFHFTGTTVDS